MATGILLELLPGQPAEIESRVPEQAEISPRDLQELRRAKPRKPFVLFSPEGWNGGGSDLGFPVDGHREVDAEEGVPQIGDRVDVGLQAAGEFLGIEIQTLEGQDPEPFREPELQGDPIGIESGAVDDESGGELFVPGLDAIRMATPVGVVEQDADAFRLGVFPERPENLEGIRGGGVGGPKGLLDGPDPGFDGSSLLGGDELQFDPVAESPTLQFRELGQVGLGLGDDELAAGVEPEPSLEDVVSKGLVAFPAEPGLKGVSGVVESGMEHAGIPTARMASGLGLLVDERDGGSGMPGSELARHAEPDHPTPDDQIVCRHALFALPLNSSQRPR